MISLLAAPVAAHGGEEESIEEQKVRAEGQVAPGRILELDFEAHEGEVIAYGLTSRVTVSWDVHEHVDGMVERHAHGVGTDAVDDSFTVPHDGVFSFMVVSHDNNTGKVRMSLEGRFALAGSAGLEMQEAPTLPPALLLVTLGILLWASSRSRRSVG